MKLETKMFSSEAGFSSVQDEISKRLMMYLGAFIWMLAVIGYKPGFLAHGNEHFLLSRFKFCRNGWGEYRLYLKACLRGKAYVYNIRGEA